MTTRESELFSTCAWLCSMEAVVESRSEPMLDFTLTPRDLCCQVQMMPNNAPGSKYNIPVYQLDEVWVHIIGVPHVWRHYLAFWALGSVVGATSEVDMLTYRKKGIIRVLVGMLNRDLLPYITHMVFRLEGYNITFTLESTDFEPATPPSADNDPLDQDGEGAGKDNPASSSDLGNAAKKPKNDGSSSSTAPTQHVSGPTPMQTTLYVTPLGKSRPASSPRPIVFDDIQTKRFIAVTPPRVPAGPGNPLGGSQPDCAKGGSQPDCVQGASQPDYVQGASAVGCTPPDNVLDGSMAMPIVYSRRRVADLSSEATSDKLQSAHASPVQAVEMQQPVSTLMPESTEVHSTLAAAGNTNLVIPTSSGIVPADEDTLQRAMKRTASRNLDGPVEQKTVVDHSSSPLSPFTSHNMMNGFGYSGVSTIGTGSQGVFYPGAWVAV